MKTFHLTRSCERCGRPLKPVSTKRWMGSACPLAGREYTADDRPEHTLDVVKRKAGIPIENRAGTVTAQGQAPNVARGDF